MQQQGRVWRHYYRCRDCLTTAVVEERLPETAECGACGGRFRYLGPVTDAARWLHTDLLPACNSACVNATGPDCECQCRGENHGTGRVVRVVRDGGAVRVEPRERDAEKARRRAEEYRAARRSVWEAARQRWGQDYDEYVAGRYVRSRGAWESLRRLDREMAEIARLATHSARMRRLEQLRRRILELETAAEGRKCPV